jgi:uncharacterized protein
MKNPLLVNALELLRRPGSEKPIAIEVSASDIGLGDPRLVAGAPIEVDLLCSSLNDSVVVEGVVRAVFHGECRRCLAPVTGRLDVEVRELYQQTITDPDAFPIENDQIDLKLMVRESVLLDLPEAPVCRPDCRGLCPTCGVDRNVQTCSCTAPTTDPRWAALDALRDQLSD